MSNSQYINLLTPFSENVEKGIPLNEYPRPQLKRDSFLNLNGNWDYAILPIESKLSSYQGKILVPFSPESVLSNVNKILLPNEMLHYRRSFTVPREFVKDRVILHFGAVDYSCSVFINNTLVGQNIGGYLPFSFDITKELLIGKENEIRVEVTDPSDTSYQGKGKQKLKRGNIFYTPQSGIWQTVWLESVSSNYVKSMKILPDIDGKTVSIELLSKHDFSNVEIKVVKEGSLVCKINNPGNKHIIKLDNFELWTPETPHLYDVEIIADNDILSSYFGMRKFSMQKDKHGFMRPYLNNKPYFHNGLLDQGYWSDGLYTPPSDEAMIYDIKLTKSMGFNMLRKHIKIEPLRWYYHCDRIGMLVWQDFVNGGTYANNVIVSSLSYLGVKIKDNRYSLFGRKSKEGRDLYYEESKRTLDTLFNATSIAVWVPFNESWGQFDANKAVDFIKQYDTSRLIDHASGWYDQGGGDFISRHIYFIPVKYIPKEKDRDRIYALTEFGGYSVNVDNHVFNTSKSFGYKKFDSLEQFEDAVIRLYEEQIIPLIKEGGLSATVYTQLSDVEDEINGLVTYDRRVVKVDIERMRELNQKLTL